ncbi:RHS repeat-associated core domain-containing protein, partial [Tenacibaculum sp. 190524A02b]|uniref:RHS repeat-associated core domain-containing protein n=1 Tax=Tenacibaculum vairaonense TaxID=3137860 RepID=UPI0032B13E54
ENVGRSGRTHTRASYLAKVEGLRGKTLNYTYQKKEAFEYSDPHTENGRTGTDNDRDAYQERYEDRYLSAITLKNRKDQQIKKINLEYTFLNKGTELQKRLLKGVHYLDAKDDPYMPAKTFDYFGINTFDGVKAGLTKAETKLYNTTNGALFGAIKQENMPEGVSYAFQYGKQKITGASKTLPITFPKAPFNDKYKVTSRWSAPELFYGNDYVVAIFESQDLTQRKSHVKVYQWIGDRWNEQDLGTFNGYFYDRYPAKDQYSKGILKQAKGKLFEALGKTPGGQQLNGVINALNDGFSDFGKTLYRTGDDLAHGKVGKAIEDWFKGQGKLIEDVVLDIAASFEKEAEQLVNLIIEGFGTNQQKFIVDQKKLYEQRQKDEANNPRKQYHVVLQDDFFALTTSYGGSEVNIIQKNKLVPGTWNNISKRANLTSKFFSFESGTNFVALLDELTDFLYIYTWDGLIWNIEMTKLNANFNNTIAFKQGKDALENAFDGVFNAPENEENRLDHRSAITAKNNMILAVVTDSQGTNAEITIFHHDENRNWTTNGQQINKKAAAAKTISLHNTAAERLSAIMGRDGKLDVKMGNSFAVLQTYDNLDENLPDVGDIPLVGNLISGFVPDMKKINMTYGITWDENFENINLEFLHAAAGQTGVESFVVGDVINKIGKAHSLLVGSNNGLDAEDGKNYAFRYDGNQFLGKQFSSPYYTSGFANDVVSTLTESDDKAFKTPQFYQYDPNTNGWTLINKASQEQIAAPEFVDEAINVSVEIVNIIVQVVTLVLPGLGEALELAEETIQLIDNAANIAQVATMVMEPVAKELVKDIMGTNHKSTSIANNYISVNGKLFHRSPTGQWERVSNDFFESNGIDQDIVGGTNNIVSNFVPYTLKTTHGIENHIKLLGNGKVYDTKTIENSNLTVHQDSLSATIGASAYVSYGPITNKGFVQKNAYTEQFKPLIGSTAEERARSNRPAYKDATQVVLHKIAGLDLDNELYDYPVTKVTIKQGGEKLSAHHYLYDGNSAAYDANSHLTLYGKVTDIPTSKDIKVNTDVSLTTTDGGYIEHYFYNRYNTYGKDHRKGYPTKSNDLKLQDNTLVTYQSIHSDDSQNYSNGNITTLYGHPYATLTYNTNQKVVASNHTYYNVWEEDLRHPVDGAHLQENRIYLSRPVKKINTIDDVANVTTSEFKFAKHSLITRKTTSKGYTTQGATEEHNQYHTYAFEHYDDLRKVNRIQEPFSTINTVKQGNDPEKITGGNVVAYESFRINNKDIHAPKDFYTLANANGLAPNALPENIIGKITSNINNQATLIENYDTKVAQYHTIIGDYHGAERAAHQAHHKEHEIQDNIEQLHDDLLDLAKNIDFYKQSLAQNKAEENKLTSDINSLRSDQRISRNQANDKIKQINQQYRNINKYQDLIALGWIGGPIGFGIAYGVNHPKIEKAKQTISSLRNALTQLERDIRQDQVDINKKRESLLGLVASDNDLKPVLQNIQQALKNERDTYNAFKTSKENPLHNSLNAFNGGIENFDQNKHDTARHGLANVNFNSYQNSLNNLQQHLRLLEQKRVTPGNLEANFHNNIRNTIEDISAKHQQHQNNIKEIAEHHRNAITQANNANSISKQIPSGYAVNWIRTKTVEDRDTTTGIPLSWYDTDDTYSSVVLHPLNKKPIATFNGVNAHKGAKRTLFYDFENANNTPFSGSLINKGHTGNKSLMLATNSSGKEFTQLSKRNDLQYLVSLWIKKNNSTDTNDDNNKAFIGALNHISEKNRYIATNEWQYIEELLPANEVPYMSFRNNVLVDDILIRPIGTTATISAWDDNDMLSHQVANNGLTTTHILDDAQQHMASIDNTGRTMDFTHHGYSRFITHNQDGYDVNQPNSNMKIHFQNKATYLGDASGTTNIPANDLGNEFAIAFTANDNFTINKGNQRIQKTGNSISSSWGSFDIDKRKNILILQKNNVLVVYVNGEIKAHLRAPNANTNLQINGTVSNLLTGKDPVVDITYKDGLARNIQHQYWFNNSKNQITGKIVQATLYNGWGKPMLQTKPLYHLNPRLNYEQNFIEYNEQDGNIQGNFVSLYETFSQQNNHDYKIEDHLDISRLFTQTKYSNDPLQRVIETTMPGVNNQDTENTKRTGYQDALGASLETAIGISNANKLKFKTSSTEIRNNDKAAVKDLFGRATAMQNGNSISSYAYIYDANGNKTIQRRLPLSHTNNTPNQYKNTRVNIDLIGDQAYTNTVDEGRNYVIKNNKGLTVFSSANNFSKSKTNIKWRYTKYDPINRPIEAGVITVPGNFNKQEMSFLANTPEWLADIQQTIHKTWQYDSFENNVDKSNGKVTHTSRLINDKQVETRYAYNIRGQVTRKATYINGDLQGLIGYHYNHDGKIKDIVYPNGTSVDYTYDQNGRLYGIGTNTNPFAYAKYGYGTNGKINQTIHGNGVLNTTQKYTLQEHVAESNTEFNGAQTLFKENLEYTVNGNYHQGMIMRKTEQQEGQPIDRYEYTYDNQYRLTLAERHNGAGIDGFQFDYDTNGNLTSQSSSVFGRTNNFTYQQGTNKLQSTTETASKIGLYTKIGQTPLGLNTQLDYDIFTRKTHKVFDGLNQVKFLYDANNRRVQKTRKYTSKHGLSIDDTLTYIFGTRNLPLFEKLTDNVDNTSWDKTYIYGAQYAPIAMLYKGKTYFFVRDYQSSLRNVVNASEGIVEETYKYTPFGEILYSNHQGTEVKHKLGTYLYTGQEYDQATGLYNFKARLYHPVKKIFLTPDPKHINYSPYTYTSNNPINLTDPSGMAPVEFNKGMIIDDIEAGTSHNVTLDKTLNGKRLQFGKGTTVSAEVTPHSPGVNNIKLTKGGEHYYYPFRKNGAGYVEVPHSAPTGTCVFTGGMNGCAIEVRTVGDKDIFYHDADGEFLKGFDESSGLPGASAKPKARLAADDYMHDGISEYNENAITLKAQGRSAQNVFHYSNVAVKNEAGWDIYSSRVNSAPEMQKTWFGNEHSLGVKPFSVHPSGRAIENGLDVNNPYLLKRFPK